MGNQDESLYKKGIISPDNPSLVNAINRMVDQGYSKDYTQKITGAPYEVVDRFYKMRERGKRGPVNDKEKPEEE